MLHLWIFLLPYVSVISLVDGVRWGVAAKNFKNERRRHMAMVYSWTHRQIARLGMCAYLLWSVQVAYSSLFGVRAEYADTCASVASGSFWLLGVLVAINRKVLDNGKRGWIRTIRILRNTLLPWEIYRCVVIQLGRRFGLSGMKAHLVSLVLHLVGIGPLWWPAGVYFWILYLQMIGRIDMMIPQSMQAMIPRVDRSIR
jgi:hypothetical protein